jgi:hypothetical protein
MAVGTQYFMIVRATKEGMPLPIGTHVLKMLGLALQEL